MNTKSPFIARSILTATAAAALALTAVACQKLHDPQYDSNAAGQCKACSTGTCAAPASSAPAHVEIPTGGVHAITLPVMDTNLPPGPGKLTLMSACTLCHSPRYVTMQPKFSRKKWTDEVEKMKKVYGAPIQDEQVEPIVNYLVVIRGNGQ
ncbi:MAG TPA: hypothetical protein VFE47_09935 [Tepidisphaeraceae bacterium]|jgi:hypothetical protein|nr:hypothetical protein [Tepidisphaeraceae bacterium]